VRGSNNHTAHFVRFTQRDPRPPPRMFGSAAPARQGSPSGKGAAHGTTAAFRLSRCSTRPGYGHEACGDWRHRLEPRWCDRRDRGWIRGFVSDHILVANVGCDAFRDGIHVAEVPGKIGSSTGFWLIACSARIVESLFGFIHEANHVDHRSVRLLQLLHDFFERFLARIIVSIGLPPEELASEFSLPA